MMKLLLDESVPKRLSKEFPDRFSVTTVQDAGWSSTKNGALLKLASENGYRALITADKGFEYQQNPDSLAMAIVILRAYRTTLSDLAPLMGSVIQILDTLEGNTIHVVDA